MRAVVDASMALAWCLTDEHNEKAESLLDQLPTMQLVAPQIWPLEVSNAILQAGRRARLSSEDQYSALGMLRDLLVELDHATGLTVWGPTFALAQKHGLTAYDAVYLELAIRERIPILVLDGRLAAAAQAEGITCL